jgi:glycosyltransferase involved in cell wall biosynthesis
LGEGRDKNMEIKKRLENYRKKRKDKTNYQPFVSVVIPTYNRKQILKLVLLSLFQQSYPKDKYEVVVADDGSNDGTKEQIIKLKKQTQIPIKYVYKKNKGFCPGQARNLGAKNSKGEIIIFLDDDTIAAPNLISNHVKSQRDVDVVLGYKAGYDVNDYYDIKDFQNSLVKKDKPLCGMRVISDFRDREFNESTLSSSKTNPLLWTIFVTGNTSIKKEIFDKTKFERS